MLLKTTNLQNSASNPINSVFVSASAGSGKTKVLTDRVLRLLLAEVSPSKILCLTFTKVAAAEMQKRIFSELENWVIWDDEKLKNYLKEFTSKEPSQLEIKTARKLFATLLDDNSGLQISTIHSFCQSIIKKFPVEAKTSPSFTIIDEHTENKLLFEARKKLLEKALLDKNLAEKINLISARLNENSFLEITAELIRKRQNLAELQERYFGIDGLIEMIYSQLGVGLKENEEMVFANFIEDKNWQRENLLMLCQDTEIKSKRAIEKFIIESNLENLVGYLNAFITSENEPRKQLTTKPIQKQIPLADEMMRLEQERVMQFLEKLNTIKIAVSTASLLVVVSRIIEIYGVLKSQNGYLDYSDLIIKTSQLLENSAQREWVKYKLDGIYEHILVDESQDTNHQQWDIVKAITEEFFAGNNNRNQIEGRKTEGQIEKIGRSIFIVGDEKQSIYSFQGADPNIFANIFYYYQEKLGFIDEKFLNVELNSSFRSMPAILQIVDAVFARAELAGAVSSLSKKIEHHSIKNQFFGKVELMPIVSYKLPAVSGTKEEEKHRWKLDFTVDEEYKAQEILAQIIAKKIKKFFTDKKFSASKNRIAEFGDVMILLKERKSNLGNLLVKYLQLEQIPVSSADRIDFGKNIIVQDLLVMAKFILLPEDDLNLACLLKSPFFNISEEELLAICLLKNQAKISLFTALKEKNSRLYQELLDLIEENQKQQFSIGQFFGYFLIEKSKKEAILDRFGKAGEEIINQFLKICFDYQSNNIAASMQNFVQFLESANLTIKIDGNNHDKNQVYITTIHSAKGLEAPIVFLADTMHSTQKQIGNDRKMIFWDRQSGLPFWSGGKNFDNRNIKKIKQNERDIIKKEYWRQLYVAMTRAEEELYICGFAKAVNDGDCWYNVIKEAMVGEALEVEDFGGEYRDYLVGKGLAIGKDAVSESSGANGKFTNLNQQAPLKSVINKDFIDQIPQKETVEEFLYPSQSQQNRNSKINQQQANLGKIIHKILEFLPDLEIEDSQKRREFLLQYLADKAVSEAEIVRIINQVDNVCEKFADLFNHPNSRAEVPIIGNIDGKTVSGKIDRLIVEDDLVLIIDFKTGDRNGWLEQKYQEQMRLYELVLEKIYTNREVRSKIIWVGDQSL